MKKLIALLLFFLFLVFPTPKPALAGACQSQGCLCPQAPIGTDYATCTSCTGGYCCSWGYNCCDNTNAPSQTYNSANGYCSSTCSGNCFYEVSPGNYSSSATCYPPSPFSYTATAPSGTISTLSPTFTWTTNNCPSSSTNTAVYLFPAGNLNCSGNALMYTSALANSTTSTPISGLTCTGYFSPCSNQALAAGQTYSWKVQGLQPSGGYATSACKTFTTPAAPVIQSVTINPSPVNTNGTTQYTITVTSTHTSGASAIADVTAVINYHGTNATAYRGLLGWSSRNFPLWGPGSYTTTSAQCAKYNTFGSQFLTLDSCSSSPVGNTMTTTFVVRFNTNFVAPITANTLSGSAQDTSNFSSGWVSGSTFDLSQTACVSNGANALPTLYPPSGLVSWWRSDEGSGNLVTDSIQGNDGTTKSSINDSLVSWWKMDETSGTAVADSVNTNNGTAMSACTYSGIDTSSLYTNLVGYWKLDDGTAGQTGITAVDSAGTSSTTNGVATGTTVISTGKIANARNFPDYNHYLNLSSSSLLNPASAMTLSAWIYPTANGAGNNIIVARANGSTDAYQFYWITTDKTLRFTIWNSSGTSYTATSATNAINLNIWTHVVGIFDSATNSLKVYVNGNQSGTTTTTSGTMRQSAIGTFINRHAAYATTNYFVGNIDEVGIWSKALSQPEISSLAGSWTYSTGNPNTNHTSHWKLDDGSPGQTGVAAADSAGTNNGTATGTTVISPGKIGNARSFNGTSDSVRMSSGIAGGTTFTISAWIYRTKISTSNDDNNWITSNNTPTNSWYSAFDASDNLTFWYYNSGWTTLGTASRNQWHHVAIVVNAASGVADNLQAYIDGVAQPAKTITYTLSATTSPVWLGGRSDNATRSFGGTIDEAVIWGKALTAGEVKYLYNSGSGLTCTPSPATIVGPPPASKLVNARSFNGVSDYITIPDANSLDSAGNISLSAWIYPTGLPAFGSIIVKRGTGNNYSFRTQGNQLAFVYKDSSNTWRGFTDTSSALNTNTWYHVAVTYDGQTAKFYINGSPTSYTGTCTWSPYCGLVPDSNPVGIGGWGTSPSNEFFKGTIDEAAIWSKVLTANEVSYLYNSSAARSYDPTAGPTPSGSPPTNSVITNARSFNGLTDYVAVPSTTALRPAKNFTISAWAKFTDFADNRAIVLHDENGGAVSGYALTVNTSGLVGFGAYNANGFTSQNITSTTPLTVGQWYHLAGVYDSFYNLHLYINGNEDPVGGKQASGDVVYNVTTNLNIGRRGGTYLPNTQMMKGVIDEVRIYNTALTGAQILAEYQRSGVAATCSACGNATCGVGSQTCLDSYCVSKSQSCVIGGQGAVIISGGISNAPQAVNVTATLLSACTNGSPTTTTYTTSGPSQTSYSLPVAGIQSGSVCYQLNADTVSGSVPTPTNYQISVSCSSISGPRFWYLSNAGIVSAQTAAVNAGSGSFSQAGTPTPPGYKLDSYSYLAPITNVNYNYFLSTLLKNAKTATATLDALTLCQNPPATGPSATTTNVINGTTYTFEFFCYSSATSFNTQLQNAITNGTATTGNIAVLYPYNNFLGTQVVSSPVSIPSNYRNVLAFVNGNLQVDNTITIPANVNSGIVFILNNPSGQSGDLKVKSTVGQASPVNTPPAVGQLDGFYVFPGTFNDNYDAGVATNQLVGLGSLIGTGTAPFNLARAVSTTGYPSELWVYQPKYLNIFNNILSVSKYTWQELPPQ